MRNIPRYIISSLSGEGSKRSPSRLESETDPMVNEIQFVEKSGEGVNGYVASDKNLQLVRKKIKTGDSDGSIIDPAFRDCLLSAQIELSVLRALGRGAHLYINEKTKEELDDLAVCELACNEGISNFMDANPQVMSNTSAFDLPPHLKGCSIFSPRLVSPYMGKTLPVKNSNYNDSIIDSMIEAVASLHQKNIIHGDITFSNFVFNNHKAHLIDFEWAAVKGGVMSQTPFQCIYWAPDRQDLKAESQRKAVPFDDIYSLCYHLKKHSSAVSAFKELGNISESILKLGELLFSETSAIDHADAFMFDTSHLSTLITKERELQKDAQQHCRKKIKIGFMSAKSSTPQKKIISMCCRNLNALCDEIERLKKCGITVSIASVNDILINWIFNSETDSADNTASIQGDLFVDAILCI